MQINETMIRNVVSQVLAEVSTPSSTVKTGTIEKAPSHGVFYDANAAVEAAHTAFLQLQERSMEAVKKS